MGNGEWEMGNGKKREYEQGVVVIGDRCKRVYLTRGSLEEHMSGV
jgi:hypothetical protein